MATILTSPSKVGAGKMLTSEQCKALVEALSDQDGREVTTSMYSTAYPPPMHWLQQQWHPHPPLLRQPHLCLLRTYPRHLWLMHPHLPRIHPSHMHLRPPCSPQQSYLPPPQGV